MANKALRVLALAYKEFDTFSDKIEKENGMVFLGLVGMIIGVPLFAIIYSVIKDIVEAKLRKKGLPTETSDYIKDKK